MYTREQIIEKLVAGPTQVTFTKTDGTSRVMQCTLNEEYLPVRGEDSQASTRRNLDVVTVWDIEKDGWRSFNLNTVTEVA